MSTIFYTQMPGGPAGTIKARGAIYAKEVRNSDALKWLSARQVYATASVTGKTGSSSLGIPPGGGFGSNGLYSNAGGDKTGDRRLLPKPHVTNIKISNIGDWGSVKKLELSFTCYDLGQLESKMAFCEIGADLTVSYGWANGGSASSSGRFEGKIYNFSYSVNASGGWDCTTSAMSKGIDVVSGNSKSGTPGGSVTDPSGLTIPKVDIMSYLKAATTTLTSMAHGTSQVVDEMQFACLEYASSWGSSGKGENKSVPADATPKTDTKHFYVTLQSLVKKLNDLLLAGKSTSKLQCSGDYTKSPGVNNTKYLISANPKQMVFSPHNTYGPNHDFNVTGVNMGSSPFVDSSKVLLSLEWLATLLPDMGKKPAGTKSGDTSISAFLGSIFDAIHQNSGRRISLGLVENPKIKDGKEFWVVDVNYGEKEGVFTFNAFNKYSIARSISIQSKVPGEMASAAFVAPGAANGSPAGTLYGIKVKEGRPENKADFEAALEECKLLFDAKEPPTPPKPGEESSAGPTDGNVATMQAILQGIYNQNPEGTGIAIPYPISFSITIDGVDGILFGNTVTTNYLPKIYKKAGVVFTVTQVSHDISIGDWTTTIDTVCRLAV